MRHLECQLEEKNQELLRVSHSGGVVPGNARQAATPAWAWQLEATDDMLAELSPVTKSVFHTLWFVKCTTMMQRCSTYSRCERMIWNSASFFLRIQQDTNLIWNLNWKRVSLFLLVHTERQFRTACVYYGVSSHQETCKNNKLQA